MATIDFYSESNQNDYLEISPYWDKTAIGQSFTSNGYIITSCKWFVKARAFPTGDVVSKIYAHSGDYGISGIPTGVPLATSDPIEASTLPTSDFGLLEWIFSTPFVPENGVKYIVTIEHSASWGVIEVGMDATSSAHSGNMSYKVLTTWSPLATWDAIFYVLGTVVDAIPAVTTQAVTVILPISATGNGNVTSDGGAAITERGICWNLIGTPTTADSKATSAGTTGAYTADMTGLSPNTLYYVRAYAVNAVGTSYGEQVTVTTGGAIYYVNSASDGGDGTTQATSGIHAAFKTLAAVNALTLLPGDQRLLNRGSKWAWETLNIVGSGYDDNYPIITDAYGVGPPPEITGLKDITLGWTDLGPSTPNVWSTPLTSAVLNNCRINGVFGTKKVSAAACTKPYDWYFASNVLYVFSATSGVNPTTYYNGPIQVIMPYLDLCIIGDQSYNDINRLKFTWTEGHGIHGWNSAALHHININYCSADIGFPSGNYNFDIAFAGGDNIKIQNCDMFRGVHGVGMLGCTNSEVTNNRSYSNLACGFYADNTGVTWKNNHAFGNKLSYLNSEASDFEGGVDGGGNLSYGLDPKIKAWKPYAPIVGISYSDIWAGYEATAAAACAPFAARGKKLTLDVPPYGNDAVGVVDAAALIAIATGADMTVGGWSHQHLETSFMEMITIQYTGAGGCTLEVADGWLNTYIDAVLDKHVNLLASPNDTVGGLVTTLNAGDYTCAKHVNCWSNYRTSADLADITGQDIKTAPYIALGDLSRTCYSEMSKSKAWLEANVVGAGNAQYFQYPGDYDAPAIGKAIAEGLGLLGAAAAPAFITDTYNMLSKGGVDPQSTFEFVAAAIHGASEATIKAHARNCAFKSAIWGFPNLLFTHGPDGITATEFGHFLDGLAEMGADVYQHFTAATLLIRSKTRITGTYSWVDAPDETKLDWDPTITSPTVGAGTPITGLTTDIMGNAVPNPPSIGAVEFQNPPYLPGGEITIEQVKAYSSWGILTESWGLSNNAGLVPIGVKGVVI
jgi:hypothetical protein